VYLFPAGPTHSVSAFLKAKLFGGWYETSSIMRTNLGSVSQTF
jgi:hypothetical protein